MYKIYDIADWFLLKEKMTHKKLQKLCYYAEAWSCAIMPEPITDAVFEAWVHGPVCRDLYNKYHEYGFNYLPAPAKAPEIDHATEDFLESVWATYGDITANSLEALTHSELPWQAARAGLAPDMPSSNPISHQAMSDFYRSIYSGGDA